MRQLAQHCERRIRANQEHFRRTAEIPNDQNRIGTVCDICSGAAVASEQCGNIQRFGGSEAKPVTPVATQEPAHRAVAEHAMAIEDDQQTIAEFWKAAHTKRMRSGSSEIQFG